MTEEIQIQNARRPFWLHKHRTGMLKETTLQGFLVGQKSRR